MTMGNRDDDYPRRAAVAIAACGLLVAIAIWLVVAAGLQPTGSAPAGSGVDGPGAAASVDG